MSLDIEKELFDIPEGVEFPLELCHHLRTKLNSVLEQNCHLKRHISYLDKEVLELRKFKVEHQQQNAHCSQQIQATETRSTDSLMTSKIVELSKRNRDLTAQLESVKTKLKKVIGENEQLKCQPVEDASMREEHSPADNDEELLNASGQIMQMTNKMMEYRRQSQQLKIELSSALRALSQEVGESATPKNVLSITNHPSWRGRQQQIMTLHQKVSDLQERLNISNSRCDFSHASGDGPSGLGDGDGTISEASFTPQRFGGSVVSVSTIAPSRIGIVQKDMKKQEKIRKLTGEIEQLSHEMCNRQHELRASKARIQTLEAQTKSYRNQVELLEGKLQENELETKALWDEMNQLKQALITVKDREKRNMDKCSLEIQEANRALTRERAIVSRLQEVINDKQDALQKSDSEVIELKNKLELCCSSQVGGLNALERLQELETRIHQFDQLLVSSEKEQRRLVDLIDKSAAEAERERYKAVQAQRESAQVYVVLQQANECIDTCLDAANVTDSNLLQDVENIRTMIRELNTGGLFSFDIDPPTTVKCSAAVKRLKAKIEILTKESEILQKNLTELTDVHKKDMAKNARIYDSVKQELFTALTTAAANNNSGSQQHQ